MLSGGHPEVVRSRCTLHHIPTRCGPSLISSVIFEFTIADATCPPKQDIFNFILDQIETNFRAPASIFSASSSGGTKSRSGKEKESAFASRITDIPYYQEYLYTLESLATIKSVVCVGDIDKPEHLVMRHFEVYFKILR